MVNEDRQRILDALAQYLDQGRGHLQSIARISGLSEQTIRRVRKGHNLTPDTRSRLQDALIGLGAMDAPEPVQKSTSTKSVWDIVASDLESLAGKLRLRGKGYTDDMRAELFVKTIKIIDSVIDSELASTERSTNG